MSCMSSAEQPDDLLEAIREDDVADQMRQLRNTESEITDADDQR